MAYVFNKTLNAMGGEPDKQNIFQGQGGGQGMGLAGTEVTGPKMPKAKTSVEGALKTGKKDSSVPAIKGSATEVTAPKSAIIQRNISKQQAPQAAGQATQQIQQAGEALQQEAEDYISQPTTQYQSYTPEALESASAGQDQIWSNITSFLGQEAAPTVDEFVPETDTSVGLADKFSTAAGVKDVLREEAGTPEYSQGMGAFDMMLLSQNPQFQQTMDAIQRGQSELTKQSQGIADESEAIRQQKENEAFQKAQADIEGGLWGVQKGITEGADQEAQAYNNFNQYLQGNYDPATPEEAAQFEQMKGELIDQNVNKAIEEAIAQRPELEPYLRDAARKLDPLNFINMAQDVRGGAFIDESEAAQWNAIMDALGYGGDMTAGSPAEREFMYQNYLSNLIGMAGVPYARDTYVPPKQVTAEDLVINQPTSAMPTQQPGALAIPGTEGLSYAPPSSVTSNVTTDQPVGAAVNQPIDMAGMTEGLEGLPPEVLMDYLAKNPTTYQSTNAVAPAASQGGMIPMGPAGAAGAFTQDYLSKLQPKDLVLGDPTGGGSPNFQSILDALAGQPAEFEQTPPREERA